mmetsp:Transcript_50264/g.141294  ORF Transcript_50264/g.141294 Transcript_50264/m.141294 type:complete len:297 (+) Transcript_50264:113-1003(+)
MGCGGSREATPEERQFICTQMAKEMMLLCVHPALEKANTVKLAAPPDFDALKSGAASLRSAVPAGDGAVEAKGSGESSGLAGMMQSGLKMVSSVASQGAAAVLGTFAGGLDSAVGQVEAPFSQVAAGVVADKKDTIADVLCAHIVEAEVPDASKMCAEGDGAITKHLITAASESMAFQLEPKVAESIQQQPGLKAWNGAIEKYNAAAEKVQALKESGGLPDLGLMKPIKLDIAKYICEQTMTAIGGLMAAEEAAIRQSPEGKAKYCPDVFVKVFKGQALTSDDYKAVKKAQSQLGK